MRIDPITDDYEAAMTASQTSSSRASSPQAKADNLVDLYTGHTRPSTSGPVAKRPKLDPLIAPAPAPLAAPMNPELEQARVHQLEMFCRSLGRDFQIRLATGESWHYDPATQCLTYPTAQLHVYSEMAAMGAICRAVGRANFGHVQTRSTVQNDAFFYLWSASDTARTDQWICQRFFGARRFLQALYDHEKAQTEVVEPASKAHAFGMAIVLGPWLGRPCAQWSGDAEVSKAVLRVEATLASLGDAPKDVDLRFVDVDVKTRQVSVAACRQTTLEMLWPVFLKLLGDDDESFRSADKRCDFGSDSRAHKQSKTSGASEDEDAQGADGIGETDESSEAGGEQVQADEDKPPPSSRTENSGFPKDPFCHKAKGGKLSTQQLSLRQLFEEAAAHSATLAQANHNEHTLPVTVEQANKRRGQVGYEGKQTATFEQRLTELDTALDRARFPTSAAHANTFLGTQRRMHRTISTMVSEIGNALSRQEMPSWQGAYSQGKYNLKQALAAEFQRQATGVRNPKIFQRRIEPQERSCAIVFCIDISGSMVGGGSGGTIVAARDASVVFQSALAELDIPFGVLAYTDEAYVLAELGETPTDARREQGFRALVPRGGNNEVAAIELARRMLDGSNAQGKVVFFLTDGGAVRDTKATVLRVEAETGIKIIGIGVGAGCGEVPYVYPRHIQVPNITDLPSRVGKLLMETLVGDTN